MDSTLPVTFVIPDSNAPLPSRTPDPVSTPILPPAGYILNPTFSTSIPLNQQLHTAVKISILKPLKNSINKLVRTMLKSVKCVVKLQLSIIECQPVHSIVQLAVNHTKNPIIKQKLLNKTSEQSKTSYEIILFLSLRSN